MDITPRLSTTVRRIMARKYESQADFARAAQISPSLAHKILNPPIADGWLTETVWERVYSALLPDIETEGPDLLPRSRFVQAIANSTAEPSSPYHPFPTDPEFNRLSALWPDLDEADRLELLSHAIRLKRGHAKSDDSASACTLSA